MRDLAKNPCYDIEFDDCALQIMQGDTDVVKYLRDQNYDAYFFGLGFIQIKMSLGSRFHFYHKDLSATVEDPHNHRYNFVSTVLRGTLVNHVYEECKADHPCKVLAEMRYASCQKDGKEVEVPDPYPTYVEHAGFFTVKAPSGYYINQNSFHSVAPEFKDGPCITMLERGPIVKDFAKVMKKSTLETYTCPFESELSKDDMWKAVEECIRK
jgi:hypothetical protein